MMTRSHLHLARRLVAGIVALAAAWPLAQAAQAHPQDTPLTRVLRVPAGNQLSLIGHGNGVQIYACTATPTGFAWTFVAPRANRTDDRGRVIVTHFGGPTWQANDGSQVVGRLVHSATVNPNAIPWLQLSAASTTAGEHGGGVLADTTYIQRLFTVGGLAPAARTCDAKTAGIRSEVPYTAEYLFWKQTRRPVAPPHGPYVA